MTLCADYGLSVFRNATMYFDGKRDTQSRHLKTFAADVANKLRHCIYALEHLEVCHFIMCIIVYYKFLISTFHTDVISRAVERLIFLIALIARLIILITR